LEELHLPGTSITYPASKAECSSLRACCDIVRTRNLIANAIVHEENGVTIVEV
jgi:hypothetical protein